MSDIRPGDWVEVVADDNSCRTTSLWRNLTQLYPKDRLQKGERFRVRSIIDIDDGSSERHVLAEEGRYVKYGNGRNLYPFQYTKTENVRRIPAPAKTFRDSILAMAATTISGFLLSHKGNGTMNAMNAILNDPVFRGSLHILAGTGTAALCYFLVFRGMLVNTAKAFGAWGDRNRALAAVRQSNAETAEKKRTNDVLSLVKEIVAALPIKADSTPPTTLDSKAGGYRPGRLQ